MFLQPSDSFFRRLVSIAFPFYFPFSYPPLFVSSSEVHWRGKYAREAEVPFLSSLVLSPSTAQAAAKDLWSNGLSSQAEAKVRSAMADRAPGLLLGYLRASKGKVRNALRLQASLSSATSRLRAAQRVLRPKMPPAAEIRTFKSHKPRSACNYRV